MNYETFLQKKNYLFSGSGIDREIEITHELFPFQKSLVKWALRRGRCAIFADTGLGKTRMELEWSHQLGVKTLILTPLAVAQQIKREGDIIGVQSRVVRDSSECTEMISICNYDRLHKMDGSVFDAIVLDESSIIKNFATKTLATLSEMFSNTKYKLCATATPSPNDFTELGTHAEFLGVCTRAEMLSEFFIHDAANTQDWRLKNHAKSAFWKWVSSWGAMIKTPSDLGFDDTGYRLPKLSVHDIVVDQMEHNESVAKRMGLLFAMPAESLSERRSARSLSCLDRAVRVAEIANSTSDPFIVWCELNKEADEVKLLIPGSVEVRGTDDIDEKERRLNDFTNGKIRVLITKPSISGWGMNWQHCNKMAFLGIGDSFESYYQAVRRCWRFGQRRPVDVYIVTSYMEGNVVDNIKRKSVNADIMSRELSSFTKMHVIDSVCGSTTRQVNNYNPKKSVKIPEWLQ